MRLDQYLKENEKINLKEHPEVKEALEQLLNYLTADYKAV